MAAMPNMNANRVAIVLQKLGSSLCNSGIRSEPAM